MLLPLFTTEVKDLDPELFEKKLLNVKRAQLIDVSTKEEYETLHLPGSMNIDVLRPDFIEKIKNLKRSRPSFIYCRNGIRSTKAIMILKRLGFRHIYQMNHGIECWKGTLERSHNRIN